MHRVETSQYGLNQKNNGMQMQQVLEGMVRVKIGGYAHPGKTHSSVGYNSLFSY